MSVAKTTALSVVLPPTWWWIPLSPDGARVRAVDKLVDTQFKGVDDQPILKRHLRDQLLEATTSAFQGQGRVMAISLHRVGDIPVPATMTIYDVRTGMSPPGVGMTPLEMVQGHLAARDDTGAGPSEDRDTAEVNAGPVLRRVVERQPSEDAGDDEQPMLVADYWVQNPSADGVAKVTFSTPLVPLREAMVELFDAVLGTAAWEQDAVGSST